MTPVSLHQKFARHSAPAEDVVVNNIAVNWSANRNFALTESKSGWQFCWLVPNLLAQYPQ